MRLFDRNGPEHVHTFLGKFRRNCEESLHTNGVSAGRSSGWRPNRDFGLLHYNDAHIESADGAVQSGETGCAELWLLAPELQAGRLSEGFAFTLHEASRLVAHGVLVKVLREDLLAENQATLERPLLADSGRPARGPEC